MYVSLSPLHFYAKYYDWRSLRRVVFSKRYKVNISISVLSSNSVIITNICLILWIIDHTIWRCSCLTWKLCENTKRADDISIFSILNSLKFTLTNKWLIWPFLLTTPTTHGACLRRVRTVRKWFVMGSLNGEYDENKRNKKNLIFFG